LGPGEKGAKKNSSGGHLQAGDEKGSYNHLQNRTKPMKPFLCLSTLLLSACLMDPEPKTRVISCGTLSADTTYPDIHPPKPDTFVVNDGRCGRLE
jgi:hypothetical protein